MNLVDEVLALVTEFESAEVEYALCGGVALALHGHPRFTKDIDLLIPRAMLEPARAAARRCGFTLDGGSMTFGAGTKLERELHRLTKVVGPTDVTLDLLLVGSAYEGVWGRREPFEWRGRRCWAVSRSGLAEMKRISGRPQDLVDLEALDEADRQDSNG